jgi:hypothetical protein
MAKGAASGWAAGRQFLRNLAEVPERGRTATPLSTIMTPGPTTIIHNPKALTTLGITFIIDGNGATIATGTYIGLEVPFTADIVSARMVLDRSGSIVVDIWKDTYANFPPTDADSITASAVPTISSAVTMEDTTLIGWTIRVDKGDWLVFNVDSVTAAEVCAISLALELL